MKDAATSSDGISIVFDVDGSGDRAIVFVHGWSCDRSYWSNQVPAFTTRYRVVSVDLAGHGESGAGRGTWTMPAFGDDVVAVVERLGLDDVVLVGHSMGGDVIVEAALRLGERVRGLVWVDVYRSLDEEARPDDVEPFLRQLGANFVPEVQRFVRGFFPPSSDSALVDWVVADMSSAPPGIALDAIRHSMTNEGPAIRALRTLSAPVVAINPDHQPTDEKSLLRWRVRPLIVPGVGHMLMLEDPARFNEMLGDVIARFP